jgi:hypothetical protein
MTRMIGMEVLALPSHSRCRESSPTAPSAEFSGPSSCRTVAARMPMTTVA